MMHRHDGVPSPAGPAPCGERRPAGAGSLSRTIDQSRSGLRPSIRAAASWTYGGVTALLHATASKNQNVLSVLATSAEPMQWLAVSRYGTCDCTESDSSVPVQQVAAAVVPDERELRDGLRECLRRRTGRRQARQVDVAASRGADPGLRVRREQVGTGDHLMRDALDVEHGVGAGGARGHAQFDRARRRPRAPATRSDPRAAYPQQSPRRKNRRGRPRRGPWRQSAPTIRARSRAVPARRAAPRRPATRSRCGRCGCRRRRRTTPARRCERDRSLRRRRARSRSRAAAPCRRVAR